MSASLATNVMLPLDELEPTALSGEKHLNGTWFPALAWFLLTIVVFDMLGNLIGVPLLSGLLLAIVPAHVEPWLVWLVAFLQLSALIAAMVLMNASPWRMWHADLLAQIREDSDISNQEDESWGFATRAILGLMLAGTIAVLGLAWPAALPVVVILAGIPFAQPLFRLVQACLRKCLSDSASMTGLVIAVGVALAVLIFGAGRTEMIEAFYRACWNEGKYSLFRTTETFVMALLITWLMLIPGSRLHDDTIVHVGAPRDRTRAWYNFESFLAMPSVRVTAFLSANELLETIVLRNQPDGSWCAIDPAQPLELSRHPYTVIYLPALAEWLLDRNGRRFTLHDSRGFFRVTAELTAQPRMLDSQALPISFAPGILEDWLGLVRTANRTGELARIAQAAFEEYVENLHHLVEDKQVQFEHALDHINRVPLLVSSGQQITGSVLLPVEASFVAGMTEIEQKLAVLSKLDQGRGKASQVVEEWLKIGRLRINARAAVQAIFRTTMQRAYGAACSGVDLLENCGLGLIVEVHPAQDDYFSGGQMLRRLNDSCERVRQTLLSDIRSSQDRIFDLLKTRLAASDAAKLVILEGMIGCLPEVLPWFRNRTDLLLQFLEFALNQSSGAVRPGQLQQLLRSYNPSSTTGIPATNPAQP